jgi:enoyl-CoA hydratase/carnithine racemase
MAPSEATWPEASAPVLQVAGPVATITLNRPAHRNRLQDEDLQALLRHFEAVQDQTAVQVLVLRARTGPAAPVFSAGYHLGQFQGGHAGGGLAFEHVPDALARLRVVTLCALSGSVYGGATDLAMACDFRIGVHGMALRMPAAALGLHYYPSGLRRFVARIGLGATRRLFLRAEEVGAEDLLAMGYLDELVPAAQLDDAVNALAGRLVQMAPLALQGMKQTIQEMAWGEARMADWRAREALSKTSADFAEGRAAFAERRPPHFHGS